MEVLIEILISLALIIFLIPSGFWIFQNWQRSRGEISWKVKNGHKWSWIICLPTAVIVTAIALVLLII